MPRFLTTAIIAGLIGLVACETSPTGPTSVTEPRPSSTGTRTAQSTT